MIVVAEADVTNLKQPNDMSSVRYSNVLCEKALRQRHVYEKDVLKVILLRNYLS